MTKTNYERIKDMSLDEMVSLFVDLDKKNIIVTADRYICNKCKKEHGGRCPVADDDICLYDESAKDTIKHWLEGEAYGEES